MRLCLVHPSRPRGAANGREPKRNSQDFRLVVRRQSGVTRACRYEPCLQRTYEEMAEHYGAIAMPARPRKPKDKAKVEVGVQVVQRWILAVLRHETFFSLAALNARIRGLLDLLNDRPMRAYRASRRELFMRLDQPTGSSVATRAIEFRSTRDTRLVKLSAIELSL